MQNKILQESNIGVRQWDMRTSAGISILLRYHLLCLGNDPGRSPFWEDFWGQTTESTWDGQGKSLNEAVKSTIEIKGKKRQIRNSLWGFSGDIVLPH